MKNILIALGVSSLISTVAFANEGTAPAAPAAPTAATATAPAKVEEKKADVKAEGTHAEAKEMKKEKKHKKTK